MEHTRFTTISVRPDVRDALRARKRGGETYTAVIERLLRESTPVERDSENAR